MLLRIGTLERGLVLAIAFLYLASSLTGIEGLSLVMGVTVLITVPLFMLKLRGIPLLLSAIFMLFGAVILIVTGADFRHWINAANVNVTLVTLFVFAPLFGIPIRAPKYAEALKYLYHIKFKSKLAFFVGSQFVTQIIAIFVNVGSVPIMYHLVSVHPAASNKRLLTVALNRGFSGAMMWSPYFASMAIMTGTLGVSWTNILPLVLVVAIGSIVISVLVELRTLFTRDEVMQNATTNTDHQSYTKTYLSLLLYLLLTILIILLMEKLISYAMVIIICFAAILFPLLWSYFTKTLETYRQGLKTHLTVSLPSMQKEITLFLAAGFISGAIKNTSFGAGFIEILNLIPLPLPFVFAVITMVLIVLTAAFGLHPIIPVTIIASTIVPSEIGVSATFMAILLLGSWSISNPIAPVSAVNNLLTTLTNKNVFELAKYNYLYTFVMGVTIILYLLFVIQ